MVLEHFGMGWHFIKVKSKKKKIDKKITNYTHPHVFTRVNINYIKKFFIYQSLSMDLKVRLKYLFVY